MGVLWGDIHGSRVLSSSLNHWLQSSSSFQGDPKLMAFINYFYHYRIHVWFSLAFRFCPYHLKNLPSSSFLNQRSLITILASSGSTQMSTCTCKSHLNKFHPASGTHRTSPIPILFVPSIFTCFMTNAVNSSPFTPIFCMVSWLFSHSFGILQTQVLSAPVSIRNPNSSSWGPIFSYQGLLMVFHPQEVKPLTSLVFCFAF